MSWVRNAYLLSAVLSSFGGCPSWMQSRSSPYDLLCTEVKILRSETAPRFPGVTVQRVPTKTCQSCRVPGLPLAQLLQYRTRGLELQVVHAEEILPQRLFAAGPPSTTKPKANPDNPAVANQVISHPWPADAEALPSLSLQKLLPSQQSSSTTTQPKRRSQSFPGGEATEWIVPLQVLD